MKNIALLLAAAAFVGFSVAGCTTDTSSSSDAGDLFGTGGAVGTGGAPGTSGGTSGTGGGSAGTTDDAASEAAQEAAAPSFGTCVLCAACETERVACLAISACADAVVAMDGCLKVGTSSSTVENCSQGFGSIDAGASEGADYTICLEQSCPACAPGADAGTE